MFNVINRTFISALSHPVDVTMSILLGFLKKIKIKIQELIDSVPLTW
jgi:hypothetical protein